jgi:RNA polymerase sigma factor (sigma-70 family)
MLVMMSDEKPPGAMEDLAGTSPPPRRRTTRAVMRPPPTTPPAIAGEPLTPTMSMVLHGSTALFTITVVVPLLLTAWALVTVAGIALGGYALLHAGALEPSTLRTASAIGFALGCTLAAATVRLASAPTKVAAGEESYPVAGTLLGLVVIAGVTTLAALPHSAFFPYPLTTIAVVAAATYLALGGLLASVRVTIAVARAARSSAVGGRYRAGFLTATFLLLSASAVIFLGGPRPEAALEAAADALELDEVRGPHGVLDAVPAALCLGAGEADPGEARDDAEAPACTGLPDSLERVSEACIEQLMRDHYSGVVELLAKRYGCSADCEELAVAAAIATCAQDDVRQPPAYFTKTAINRANRWARQQQREGTFTCDGLDELPDDPCSWSDNERRADTVDRFKRDASCRMTPFERRVVWERLGGRSHREVGERLSMTETKARNTFNNTMTRLRKELNHWRHECGISE